MLKSKKVEVIADLTSAFENTTAVVICDYKGLTVGKLEALRKAAKAKGHKCSGCKEYFSYNRIK